MCGDGKPSADVEMSRLLKLMHAVEVDVVIQFLPVILNFLFKVLIQVNSDDVAVNVVRWANATQTFSLVGSKHGAC